MSANYSLLCYTREATGREEANNEDIAYSITCELGRGDDAEGQPLNENYGIFFAAGVPIAAATAESRRACTAAARFAADPFDAPRPATDAVAHGVVMPGMDITLKSLKNPFLFRLFVQTDDSPSPRPVPPAAVNRTVPNGRHSCSPSAMI